MTKVRISTTVDEGLLRQARSSCGGAKDSTVMEQALQALIAAHRAAEFDRRIDAGYTETALAEPDEWGDLASFLDAATKGRDATGPR